LIEGLRGTAKMTQATEDPIAAALFRLLSARPGFAAAGLVSTSGGKPQVVAATPALAALGLAEASPGSPALADQPAVRLDPGDLGLDAGFAAAAPIRRRDGPMLGYLLVADRGPRRLTPRLAALIGDAAALALPILEARRPAPGPGRPDRAGDTALRGAVRLRSAAERMIDTALARGGTPALMMLDLDRFRAVNEALGPAAGDALLAVTGTRLEQALGTAGRVMRLVGDRFVIVAAEGSGEVRVLARRLLQAVSQPLVLDGRTVVMQASIGIVPRLAAQTPTPALLTQADAALRRAKLEGRGRFVVHEAAAAVAAVETSRLELDLPGAAASGELRLVYQPYVDLADGRVSGVEALLRWHHPTRGTLLPASFIPMAEATGQILPLGRWALAAALAEARDWPQRLSLSVNISPLQFHQPGFLAEVDAALAASGFPAERLELEITETVLMRDNPETTAQLRALIARGIRIALDDFGTGYSALAYLARLPHHRIKLDKAFVQDLANPATAELIRAIIALARTQGIAVTAEGVERPEHLALVRGIGFTHAQGYALGVPRADAAALLAPSLAEAAAAR
jgi:diguanylate cyclase (GGDEF)-like protein